jgi:thymidylate synthase (FAD)
LNLINKKVNVPLEFITPTGRKELFDDGIGYVESYDFSRANLSNDSRIAAISSVASICYQSKTALGSESLYNRLLAESKGLPSSSAEFVPVLLHWGEVIEVCQLIEDIIQEKDENGNVVASYNDTQTSNIEKYGEWIEVEGCKYLLTNFRAIVNDFEQYGSRGVDLRNRYNTLEECEIIKQHFKVFNFKVDLPTRSQMVRHRVSWQELSRRYVSGERVPFEFYISDKMKNVESSYFMKDYNTSEVINICLNHYKQALSQGVKPQEARRIIPQAAYTQIWGAFMPKQLDNYFKLRLDSTAQYEIRKTTEAMQELIEKENTNGI